MKRILAALLFAGAVTATVAACDDGSGYYQDYGTDGCNQFNSCGTCTPIQGCGWCMTSSGQGLCAADPDECASAPAFRWAWNPNECEATTADASVGPSPDSGTPVPVDASVPDVSRPAIDAGPAPAPDASASTPDAQSTAPDAAMASDAASAAD